PCRMLRRPLASAAGPPPDVYGLSLHDALPILRRSAKKPRAALLWRRLRALALLRFGVLLLRGCVIRSSALTESVGDWRLPGVSKCGSMRLCGFFFAIPRPSPFSYS